MPFLSKQPQGGRLNRRLAHALTAYWRREGAAAASEYALMLMIIGGCGVVVLHALGNRMDNIFAAVAANMRAA